MMNADNIKSKIDPTLLKAYGITIQDVKKIILQLLQFLIIFPNILEQSNHKFYYTIADIIGAC